MSKHKKLWIGTSWKMNKTLAQATHFSKALREVNSPACIQRFLVPSFTTAREVKALLQDTDILVGAQNMHWHKAGAWTGEISAEMLVDCQLDLVELGHSERRTHFAETNHTVSLKVEAALNNALIPLVCIGETREQRDTGKAEETLALQVESALERVVKHPLRERILFAYEPVWAIGDQGEAATADYANSRQKQIIARANALTGTCLPCLYGGSVNTSNCDELIACEYIDGLFIGRAAWDVNGYIEILHRCEEVMHSINKDSGI